MDMKTIQEKLSDIKSMLHRQNALLHRAKDNLAKSNNVVRLARIEVEKEKPKETMNAELKERYVAEMLIMKMSSQQWDAIVNYIHALEETASTMYSRDEVEAIANDVYEKTHRLATAESGEWDYFNINELIPTKP